MRRKRQHSRGSSLTDVRQVSSTQLAIVQLEDELAFRERQPERAHASKVRRNNETSSRGFSAPESRDAAVGHDTPPPHDSESTIDEDHDYFRPPANDDLPSTSKDMNVNARGQPATRRSAPVKMLHGKRSSVRRCDNNAFISIPVDDLLRHRVQICHSSSKKARYQASRSPSDDDAARNKTQNRSSHQKKYSKKETRKYTKTRSRSDSSSSRSRTRERYPSRRRKSRSHKSRRHKSRSHKSRSHKSRSHKSRRSRKLSRSPNSSRSRSSTSSSCSSRSGHSSRSSVSTRHTSRKKKKSKSGYRMSPCSTHDECSCRLSPCPASRGHKNYHTQNRRSQDNARTGNRSHSNSSMQKEGQEDSYQLQSPVQSPVTTKHCQAHSENKKMTSRNQEVPDSSERRHRKSADHNSSDRPERRHRKSADRNSNDSRERKHRKSADHNSNDHHERHHRKSADRGSDTGSVRSSSRTSNQNFLQRLVWKSHKQETGHSSRQKESSKDSKVVKNYSQTKQQKTDEVTRQRHRRHDSPEPRDKNKENLSCTLM
ncbi:pre-mRNA-splicing factor CWC22 homolog [Physella acuta]|uniref:pre-mRNA-splicing factor CWC22 homolog n=1 Tax=Physella acuta TaxID=109671 RepID=UPI0027DAD19F|nr:pre-mRNA-splicing factor CWC22 homolog [Physella acuta]